MSLILLPAKQRPGLGVPTGTKADVGVADGREESAVCPLATALAQRVEAQGIRGVGGVQGRSGGRARCPPWGVMMLAPAGEVRAAGEGDGTS